MIDNAADLVVVDSGGSPKTAENAIALIRGFTRKPVSVLINTHWHGDHNLGNVVFRREFPGIRVAAGQDLAALKESLDLSTFVPAITGGDPRRSALFKDWWSDPIARSAWLEARGEPVVQGASDETG